MNSKGTVFWKFDSALLNVISWACLSAGIYCFGWAALIVLGQGLGWLKFGEWQPVPFYALFLSEEGQAMISAYSRAQPLSLVPSWGSTGSLEQQAAALAGSAVGLRKIVTWLLDLPLVVPLVVAGFLLLAGCGLAADEAKAAQR